MCLKEECYLVELGYGFEMNGKRGFNRGNYIPYRTIFNYIENRSRYSVFCSAYRYNITDISKSSLYGDLYLDFDGINEFEKVRKDALTAISYLKIVYHINENQIKIYYSGNKGIHIIIPASILGVEPTPLLNGIYKTIALSIKSFTPNKTIDTQIYDNRRMFRIPNTIHEKSKLYKIPITFNELKTFTEEQIKVLAQQPRQLESNAYIEDNKIAQKQFQRAIDEFYILNKEYTKDRKYKTIYNFVPPCIQHILDNGALEGQRNITIACLTGFCKNSGKSLNETIDYISKWNSKNIKPTGEQEMKRTIRSIFMGEKIYGCSTLTTISICDKNKCKLSKKKEGNNNAIKCKSN